MLNKLVIGTANFGMTYGQGDHAEKLSEKAIREIIELAKCHGIQTLDTAISYGDCSQRLGNIDVKEWKIITKVPQIPNNISNVFEWVEHIIYKSVKEIGISSFEGILIHNPKDITGKNGEKLLQSLHDLKIKGLTKKIGVSVYGKDDLESILKIFQPEIVQCPLNIIDTRMLKNNYLSNLSKMGIEIHIRSIFLQGILSFSSDSIPKEFIKFKDFWTDWKLWLMSKKLNPIEACIRFVNSIEGVNKIILGVNSTSHLEEIFHYYRKPPIYDKPKWNSSFSTELIDPRLWNKKKTS